MKTMTLDEMKLAVCEKLPELIEYHSTACPCIVCTVYLTEKKDKHFWKKTSELVNWPTEGLQVCHEAEKLLTKIEIELFKGTLRRIVFGPFEESLTTFYTAENCIWFATYEQRIEALCRIWFPEKFQ